MCRPECQPRILQKRYVQQKPIAQATTLHARFTKGHLNSAKIQRLIHDVVIVGNPQFVGINLHQCSTRATHVTQCLQSVNALRNTNLHTIAFSESQGETNSIYASHVEVCHNTSSNMQALSRDRRCCCVARGTHIQQPSLADALERSGLTHRITEVHAPFLLDERLDHLQTFSQPGAHEFDG